MMDNPKAVWSPEDYARAILLEYETRQEAWMKWAVPVAHAYLDLLRSQQGEGSGQNLQPIESK
jgi:hypothetical protein